MKLCPFCAERIQDGAVVCRYCQRDLPAANISARPSKHSSRKRRGWLWIAVSAGLVLLLLLPVLLRLKGPTVGAPGVAAPGGAVGGTCSLDATAAPAPGAKVSGTDDTIQLILVKNRGINAWTDATLTIRGLGAVGSSAAGKPTGPHSLRVGNVDGDQLIAKNIDEFKNAEGANWIPMMMRPTEVTIRATVGGRACSFEQRFNQ